MHGGFRDRFVGEPPTISVREKKRLPLLPVVLSENVFLNILVSVGSPTLLLMVFQQRLCRRNCPNFLELNKAFFIWDKCFHLSICLELMNPQWPWLVAIWHIYYCH